MEEAFGALAHEWSLWSEASVAADYTVIGPIASGFAIEVITWPWWRRWRWGDSPPRPVRRGVKGATPALPGAAVGRHRGCPARRSRLPSQPPPV